MGVGGPTPVANSLTVLNGLCCRAGWSSAADEPDDHDTEDDVGDESRANGDQRESVADG
jgi:hypothetical protein